MDGDISRWILEFLLRSSVPDSLIRKIVTVLPLSDGDSRLKKTLLLRTLQSQLYKASVTETTLEILEVIEEIDRKDAIAVTDTMKQAYCAVAVECTVKYLAACPENAGGEFFEAVKRIWRGRVKEMEAAESTGSELLSGELNQWMDEIEAAVWDAGVCERLANMNSRRDALNKVKGYLKEALEIMGPSFLDSVATLSKVKGLRSVGGNTVRDECGDRIESDDGACCIEKAPVTGANLDKEHLEERVEERHLGVCESAFAAEPMSMCDGRLESSANTRRDVVAVDRIKSDDGACCMEEAPVTGANQNKEQLGERVEASVEGSQESGECDSPTRREKAIQKGKLLPKRKHSALRRCHRGVKISGAEEVSPAKPGSKYDPLPSPEVNEVRESLKSSSLELRALVKDPLPDALHMSEVVRMELAMKDKNLEPPSENQSRDLDVPDPNICKSIVLYQPKLPNVANLRKKSSVHCSYAHRPSFMERKSTARTYEWDDSLGNLPQVTLPRRKKRKWTSLEEETLRAGVQKFGEGSWATIRNFYSDIFENRSGVDLKDKWRNMMR